MKGRKKRRRRQREAPRGGGLVKAPASAPHDGWRETTEKAEEGRGRGRFEFKVKADVSLLWNCHSCAEKKETTNSSYFTISPSPSGSFWMVQTCLFLPRSFPNRITPQDLFWVFFTRVKSKLLLILLISHFLHTGEKETRLATSCWVEAGFLCQLAASFGQLSSESNLWLPDSRRLKVWSILWYGSDKSVSNGFRR